MTGLPGLLTLPWQPEVRPFAFLHMFPALSICSLRSLSCISSPSSVNWPSDSYSWKICPGNLNLKWTLTPMNQVLEGKRRSPFPDTFDCITASISTHTMATIYHWKVISLMHEGQLSPMWLIAVMEILTQINVISSSDKKALLYLCSLSLWDNARPFPNQNILLLCLHFQRR